ncbi:MAG: LCP family protein [Candidatus Margulisbacteria bacterium]|nr:LCP family protein [Candidatus Margulisiibacteriota bacterium]MBU1022154.1 LCP family protein [Candidatus Margulisiibacteriota bacterium]MBU1729407.1 LCP family protein [Candidatus Margulisiibacteriota bacterium]MBU1955680.1 LCP family protein [Candidatus Margulisiibacteriota bacterium]
MRTWESDYFSRRYKTKPPKRGFPWGKTIFAIVFLLLTCFSAFLGFMIPVISKFALLETFLAVSPNQPLISSTNILVLGVDEAFGSHRSDTIMVVHLDPYTQKTSIVAIPRDTIAVIPGKGLDKINHAYVFGGPELSRQTVQNFLGVSIPYYVTVDIHGLARIIDELGGVEITVEKRMYYVDYAGGLYINLWPGKQVLLGKDAVAYCRFRHDHEGDFGRIRRQQQFLQAIAVQLMNRNNIFKSPKLFLELIAMVKTNLNSRQILGVALGVRASQEQGKVTMTSIPGIGTMINGVYYYKPDSVMVEHIAEKYLRKKISNIGSTSPSPLELQKENES